MVGKIKGLLILTACIGSMFSELVLLLSLMFATMALGFSIVESKGDGHEY